VGKGFATVTEEEGVSVTSAEVNGFTLSELRFPESYLIGLGELAEIVGVHPTYLGRAFRAHYGLSVGEYGRRLRLAWAAAELARGEKPLAEIATSAGFADQSHFTRVFRRHIGTTPARYREQAQSRTFQNP